jgi:hypothetical protein
MRSGGPHPETSESYRPKAQISRLSGGMVHARRSEFVWGAIGVGWFQDAG